MRPSVFMSHNADKAFVRKLTADLRSAGVTVWVDEAEMKIGDSLFGKIEAGINDSQFLAVVLSPNSVNSSWVQRELKIALSQEAAIGNVKVLPLLYRDCSIPAFLSDKYYADFRDGADYQSALALLFQRLGVPESTATTESEVRKVLTLMLECWFAEDEDFFRRNRPDVHGIHLDDIRHCLLEYVICGSTAMPPQYLAAKPEELSHLKKISNRYKFIAQLVVCDRPWNKTTLEDVRREQPGKKSLEAVYIVTKYQDNTWLVMTEV